MKESVKETHCVEVTHGIKDKHGVKKAQYKRTLGVIKYNVFMQDSFLIGINLG